MHRRIRFAQDGLAYARKAAVIAGGEARLHGARLVIVYAYDPAPEWLGDPLFEEALARRVAAAKERVEEAKARVGEVPGLEVEVLEGPPAEAILRVAEIHEADLIAMGTRGLGGLAGTLPGSLSQELVIPSETPVLPVR